MLGSVIVMGVACLDLVDEQRDNGTAGAHNVAVTGAADGSALFTLSSYTGIGVDDVLHHGLGDTHSVDGVSSVGGQADNTLDASVNSGVQLTLSVQMMLVWTACMGKNSQEGTCFKGSGMEDVINTGHCVTDRLRIADIADIELHLLGVLRVLGLEAHGAYHPASFHHERRYGSPSGQNPGSASER